MKYIVIYSSDLKQLTFSFKRLKRFMLKES